MPLPSIANIRWLEDHDVEFRADSNKGRLGAAKSSDGETVDRVIDGGRSCLRLSASAASKGPSLNYSTSQYIQHEGRTFNDAYSDFYAGLFEFEIKWSWDSGFTPTDSQRLQFLRLSDVGTVLAFSLAESRFLRVFHATAGATIGTVAMPDRGTTFGFRVNYNAGTGSNGEITCWVNTTAGYPEEEWVQVYNRTGLSGQNFFNNILLEAKTPSAYTAITDPFEVKCFSLSQALTEANNPNTSTREHPVPAIAGYTDAELWALIKNDDWRKCMSLDRTSTSINCRIHVEQSAFAFDWLGYFGWVEYSTDQANWTEAPALDLTSSPHVEIGNVGHVRLSGLSPGRAYYWRPVVGDGDGSSGSNNTQTGPIHTVKTAAALGVAKRHSFILASCVKTYGRNLPHMPFLYAQGLAEPPEVMREQDDGFYLDDPEFETDGGAAYLWDTGHARLARQALEDPLRTGLHRMVAWSGQIGDHEIDDNWTHSWIGSSTALTDSKYSNESSPTQGGLVDNGLSWWSASFADGFEGLGTDDTSAFTAVPYRPDRRHWRAEKDGRLHLIQLDTRRQMGQSAPVSGNNFLGDQQHDWFISQISDTECPIKAIFSPSPLGDLFSNSDNWSGFLAARDAFLAAISNHLPTGHKVVVFTGDRHVPFVATEAKDGVIAANGGGNNPANPDIIAEINGCPIGSSWSHYNFGSWQDSYWALRGKDAEAGSPASPDAGDHVISLCQVVIDTRSGDIEVTFYDESGSVMNDQAGNNGAITLAGLPVPARYAGLDPAVVKPSLVDSGGDLKPSLVNESYAGGVGAPSQLKPGLVSVDELKPGLLDGDDLNPSLQK